MAKAAWTTSPSLRLSSWSCIGPRNRSASVCLSASEGSSLDSSTQTESAELLPSRGTRITVTAAKTLAEVAEWSTEIESRSNGAVSDVHVQADPNREEAASLAPEIRYEEAAVMAEVGDNLQTESSAQETKEVDRFFPPGKIMHIISPHFDNPISEPESPVSGDSDDSRRLAEEKTGIFLTPRALYSKLRLSQTMVSDHLMPVYRRQMEKLIKELEEEDIQKGNHTEEAL